MSCPMLLAATGFAGPARLVDDRLRTSCRGRESNPP